MKFSIIVPVYNTEPYLEKCILSLKEQTFTDIEIILIDDGSTDNSPQICDQFSRIDSRIKVIHKENGGLSDARNKGMAAASGEYILFVDSDDYIEPDACRNFARYCELGCDMIVANAVVEGDRIKLTHIPADSTVYSGTDYLYKAVKSDNAPMAAWLNAYRRAFLIENNLFFKYGILHEDEQFSPRCFLKANSVICTDILFYHYVIRSNSISKQANKRKNARDLFDTCLELEQIYTEIADGEFRSLLLDSLVVKYLNMFQIARLYRYGREYIHKDFVKRNAYNKKTKMKARLFRLSPVLYWHINHFEKIIRKRNPNA